MPATRIIEAVNINDPDALKKVVDETGVTAASKADRIASATKRTITEKMELDPSFYARFSELLEETIRDYRAMRLSEVEYLNTIMDIARKVATKDHGAGLPPDIKSDDDAAAFYGIIDPILFAAANGTASADLSVSVTQRILAIVKSHLIVDLWSNDLAQNKMRNAIDDYCFDHLRDDRGLELPIDKLDELQEQIMRVARARFPA
jgi:type I restriction enzyme R subunit